MQPILLSFKKSSHKKAPDERAIGCFFTGKLFVRALSEHHVGEDAEDQRASDGGQGNLAEGDRQTADTGDEDDGGNEQVLVSFQVDLLDHLKTADSDEAVQSHAHTTHDAGGDGVNECYERIKEGNDDGADGGSDDGDHGSVAGDGHARYGLAVGGVRAAAEERAGDGANAVTQQGAVQAGILQQILFNDRGDILVVSQRLGKDHERHGM